MKYFGCLKKIDMDTLSDKEKLDLYIKKGMYTSSQVMNLNFDTKMDLLDPKNYTTVQKPAKELTLAYYKYLTSTYQEQIDGVLIDFFHSFNNQILTLETKKAKKIARQHYLSIVNGEQSPNFDLVGMSQNEKGIKKVQNTPKLELYSIKQDALRTRLVDEYKQGLDCYLLGEAGHFNTALINRIPILKEIIQFESEFKILNTLNEEYEFENLETRPVDKVMVESSAIEEAVSLPLTQKKEITLTMPSDEEMDKYLLEYVFSKKGIKSQRS